MKKLMIAAAVAAFAGGAFAANYVYDFSATLKTTKGKSGKSPITVQLGVDATGTNFWYTDSTITNFLDDTKKIGGVYVPTISDAQMKTNLAAQAAVKAIVTNYNNKSAGQWCATWKWTDTGCYRTAGSVKLSDVLEQADCCVATYNLTNAYSLIQYAGTATAIGTPLAQMFGSLDAAKANKVEIFAQAILNTAATEVFSGWLAGQGTRAQKNNKYYISTLSGNIVGTLPAPVCPNCCTLPTPAWAFDCVNPTGAFLPYTAGFGTFRLKINTKKSTF